MHRNRRATRWGAADDFSGHMAFNTHSEDTENERNRSIESDAQINIDFARMEARLDDPKLFADERYIQYNEDTEAALRQVTAPWLSRQQRPAPISSENASKMIFRGRPMGIAQPKDVLKSLQEEFAEPTPPTEEAMEIIDHSTDSLPDDVVKPDRSEDLFDQLTVEQDRILRLCSNFFKKRKQQIDSGGKIKPKPLRFLVHGGPGTGKSFLTKRIKKLSERFNVNVECMAMTGIAGGIMPGGSTCHHKLSLPVCDMNENPKLLKPEKVNQLQHRIKSDSLAMVIIDEISFITPGMLSVIETRLTELLGSEDVESDKSFGGVAVIIMGDFFQLPPVPNDTLFAAVINKLVRKKDVNKGSKESKLKSKTRENGADLVTTFKKFELTEVQFFI